MDAEATLERTARGLAAGDYYHRALHSWLVVKRVDPCFLEEVRKLWTQASDGLQSRSYRQVVALAVCRLLGPPDEITTQAFNQSLNWVLGTSLQIGGVPTGFAADAMGVLVVSLAICDVNDTALRNRLADWLDKGQHSFGQRFLEWERSAFELSCAILKEQPFPVGATLARAATERSQSLDEQQVLQILRVCLDNANTKDDVHAALLLSALVASRHQAIANIDFRRPTIGDLLRVLSGVTHGMQEWTWEFQPKTKGKEARKWHVDNEYHVQNLLWAVLAPIFPDLKRELFSAPVGPIQPRLDLAIPSLALVVEVKFFRAGKPLKDVINEIAEDASLYFVQGSRYEKMVAFVWDDGQRIEEHFTVADGIRSLPRTVGAVIMGRPGKMNSEYAKTKAKKTPAPKPASDAVVS